ncbi:MAG: hypothetical protein AAF849_01145 [Bacteroidota bacterium]
MLSNFRPYCPLLIYLLLISYGELSFQQPLFQFVTSVAHLASVQNTHTDFFRTSSQEHGEHIHSQELAAQKIVLAESLLDSGEKQDSEQEAEIPQEDLKIKQDFVLKDSPDDWSSQQHLQTPLNYISFIPKLLTPPPKV